MAKLKRNILNKNVKSTNTIDLKELNKKRFSSAPRVSENVSASIKKEKLKRSVKGFKIYDQMAKEIDDLVLKKQATYRDTSKEKDWDRSQLMMFFYKIGRELKLEEIYEPLDDCNTSLTISKLTIKKHLQKYK